MHTHRISHETSASSAEYIRRYFEEHLGPKKKPLVTILTMYEQNKLRHFSIYKYVLLCSIEERKRFGKHEG